MPFSPEIMVIITHEQNIICRKTPLNGTTHEQTIICRQLFAGHVVGSQPMKKEQIAWNDKNTNPSATLNIKLKYMS